MDFLKRAWAEINLDSALDNWNEIVKLSEGRKIMPVVKADAYGHGANFLAKLYEDNGAYGFAVSNINEAIKLRKYGIKKDILVLGFTPIMYIQQMYAFNITQAVYCLDYAKQLSKAAKDNSFIIKTHIKLDTGMSRIGFDCRNDNLSGLSEINKCLSLPSLKFNGIFTHFSSADSNELSDIKFTEKQYSLFRKAVDMLKKSGIEFEYIHCSNSAASALRASDYGNLIRPGITLYGLPPALGLDIGYTPKQVMSVKSVVSMVKEIVEGDSVSYGRTFTATQKSRIATIPIGYADGYPRVLSNRGKVIINGQFAPILGRICMDQMTVDISNIENVDIGTDVTVIGQDGDLSITFDDIADMCNTISYEIMCNISIRMPRVYVKNNKITNVVYLGGTL